MADTATAVPDWAQDTQVPDWAQEPVIGQRLKPKLPVGTEASTTYGGPPMKLTHDPELSSEIVSSLGEAAHSSPADLYPEQKTIAGSAAKEVLSQVNLENLAMLTGIGEVWKAANLAKNIPRIATLIKAMIGAYFAEQGALGGGESAGHLAGTPDESDSEKGKDIAGIGVNALMEFAPMGEAILSGKVKPSTTPPVSGSALERRQPGGAIPPQVPTAGIPFRGIPSEMVQGKRVKPTVPGEDEPVETRETELDNIRRAQAKTIAQIQQLLSKSNLSREQARFLRNMAWGITPAKPAGEPVTAPTVQTPPKPQKPVVAPVVTPQKPSAPPLGVLSPEQQAMLDNVVAAPEPPAPPAARDVPAPRAAAPAPPVPDWAKTPGVPESAKTPAPVANPEMVGMGAALKGETSGGAGDDIYGIAERVRVARAASGAVASVPRGEGTTAPDSIEHGRDMLSAGGDPEKALADFERTKLLNADTIALTRAHGEELALAARRIEEKFGTASSEYRMAWKALSDWDTRTKPLQTEWHRMGEAQQGETDIDTGSFTGLQQAYHGDTGKDFTPQQAKTATDIADKVTKATDAVEKAKGTLYNRLDEATGTKTPLAGKSPSAATPKAQKAAFEASRGQFGDFKKGSSMSPEQVKSLWTRAKAYLDAGETDFDDIRHKLAVDFGIPVEDVTRGLAQPKGVKAVTDEMYRRMSEQRRMVQAAKTWIKNQQMPGWLRFMRSVPRAFFIDKIFGHGTVGMITHAGLNIFNPSAWRTYWPNFFRQYKLLASSAYHERMMQDLTRDPLFVKARRAGLVNDPFRYQDDYQGVMAAMQQYFHKLGLGGNRGFDSLKLFRQARFNQIWNSLPDTLRTKDMAKMVADSVNHSTGVVRMQFREWANWSFFAPKLEGSRWAWMVGDPLKAAKTFADWGNSTPEARSFAMSELKQKAFVTGTYFSLLALNQGLLSATGSNQKVNWTDPRRGDFLAFKVGGYNLGLISPLLGTVRLFANLLHASTGKRGKMESLSSRSDEFGQVSAEYIRGKLSPFVGFGADIASQADYAGRPMPFSNDSVPAYLRRQGTTERYSYGEYAAEQFTPIPIEEAVKEVWRSQGMSESQIKVWMRALTTAVVMGGTGARLSQDFHKTPPAP